MTDSERGKKKKFSKRKINEQQTKRHLKEIHICGCRCNERLKSKTDGSTRLTYTGQEIVERKVRFTGLGFRVRTLLARDLSLRREGPSTQRMQRAATETFTNQEGVKHALLQRSQCATNEGEQMKGANAQVTEWGFSDCGKTDAMSLSSGSSGSRGCMEKEESRHRHHLEWLESLVL